MKYFYICLLAITISSTAFAQHIGLTRQSQNGVIFVSGGIGQDQQQALQLMRQDFNLQLVFAAKGSGEYFADVMVHIQSKAGIIFVDTKSEGPIFLAKLAPGDYQITAKHGEESQTRMISVDNTGIKELDYYW